MPADITTWILDHLPTKAIREFSPTLAWTFLKFKSLVYNKSCLYWALNLLKPQPQKMKYTPAFQKYRWKYFTSHFYSKLLNISKLFQNCLANSSLPLIYVTQPKLPLWELKTIVWWFCSNKIYIDFVAAQVGSSLLYWGFIKVDSMCKNFSALSFLW